jgi:hypothetical protein
MTVRSGIVLALALLRPVFAFIRFPSAPFTAILVLYHAMGSLYSAYLRKIAWVDVVVLVAMYILRLLGARRWANIVISPWLLAFSVLSSSAWRCLSAPPRSLPGPALMARSATGLYPRHALEPPCIRNDFRGGGALDPGFLHTE